VFTVELNQPERLNALDDEAAARLAEVLDQARSSDAAVVLITGAGRAFSSGADRQSIAPTGTFDSQVDSLLMKSSAVVKIRELPQLTVAAINGPCAGSAIGIAGACHLRYASELAIFNTAYLSLGLSGDYGVADALTRAMGAANALDWLLRPRKITPAQAYSQGFVQEVLPATGFAEAAVAIASELAALPRHARTAAMQNIAEAARGNSTLRNNLRSEASRHVMSKVALAKEPRPLVE
jgi:2-(1,2-epoxy-1,2-dihydrophenyl)acetyl-CoA isomerase